MTPSRRHLFALLGLVLPVAAFTASPVAAATSSTVHHKPTKHHASTSHKAKPHSSVKHASHKTHKATHKPVSAS